MRFATSLGGLAIVLIFVAACGDVEPTTTGTVESPGASSQTQQTPTPTATPSPKLPGSITPVPASERYKLDLGGDMVVAFVEGLSPAYAGKVAYVTHVPSGSQLVLNRDGHTIDRHDGRGDGPGRLDAVLADEPTMDRIMEVLQSDEDAKPRDMYVLWIHSIRFGGIEYVARWRVAGPSTISTLSELTEERLGPEVYRVAFRRNGYVGLGYRYQDGDATYLDPGTPVYAVKGYSPEFWLATLDDGAVRLFEADTNPNAKTGEDLLDIRGKVSAIDILDAKDQMKVLGTIDDERAVEAFVETVLESPVDQGMRDREGPRFFLAFRLADGTSVRRTLWLESGELSRGIMTDPAVTLSVWHALGEDDQPVATDGAPRISERLAARLGLAYLGRVAPELQVIGKPHSPVVRLMRMSEFNSLRGLASSRPSDPWVWVVEAQGLWRTGGIVPKNKREYLSFGAVAFEADKGSRYGSSYTNASLLQGPDRSPLVPRFQAVELTAIDTHYDNNSISLWWEDPDWEVDYWVVERSVSQDGPWMAIAVKRPGELRPQEKLPQYDRWADAKLPPGERYFYRIYSCTESGRSGYSNVASGVVPEFMPGLEPPIEAKEAVEPPC